MIKIGRRGSLSGIITVNGRQGHAAYPHLADNPVRGLMQLADALLRPAFDAGTKDFQPTNLEITSIDVGNPATNVIPAKATLAFNIRFNDSWTAETHPGGDPQPARPGGAPEDIPQGPQGAGRLRPRLARPAEPRLPDARRPPDRHARAVGRGRDRPEPQLSTSGGTSDARFIKDYCPVVEFGLVGKTMHMVDERVALADLETLTDIYQRFLEDWFG